MRTPYQIKRALAKCGDDHCICDECVFSDGNVKKWRSLMSDALIYIEQLESMRHGRWIQKKTIPDFHYCSICGVAHKMRVSCNKYLMPRYCPHCGAKMDGKAV